MNCSVNLVPAARAEAHTLASRRRTWISVCVAGALLVALGWTAQSVTRGALMRLKSQADAVDARRALVQSRILAADEQRGQLLARVKLIAAARRRQPWPARLIGLTRSAPEGVFLTQLSVSSKPGERPEPPAAAARPASAGRDTPLRMPAVPAHVVRLQGLALDHTALIQLLNALQSSPYWQHVELVRATSEPYAGRTVVAFEFECRSAELTQ
jgi:Tfp pilus assembly protein PilN